MYEAAADTCLLHPCLGPLGLCMGCQPQRGWRCLTACHPGRGSTAGMALRAGTGSAPGSAGVRLCDWAGRQAHPKSAKAKCCAEGCPSSYREGVGENWLGGVPVPSGLLWGLVAWGWGGAVSTACSSHPARVLGLLQLLKQLKVCFSMETFPCSAGSEADKGLNGE